MSNIKTINIPKHIAIIPDGNRRWAREKGLSTFEGHRRGFDQAVKVVRKSRELGIKIVTLWAFSTENWNRTENEVSYLMKLYEIMIDRNLKESLKEQVRIIHIGRKDRLSETLENKINIAEEKTKDFDKYYLVIALDYGGRDEIIRTINRISNSKFQIPNLEEKFADFLDTKDLPYPDVDLIIRTSGEQRTSGFMIWQAAYSEYIFSDKYFPDFTPQDLVEAIKKYQIRQRRLGI